MLDAKTLQFSFIDLPEHLKGQGHLYMTGETKNGKVCMVYVFRFTLDIWFGRADADGVEKWILHNVIPLEGEILGATETSPDDYGAHKINLWAVLDGTVYFSTKPTRRRRLLPTAKPQAPTVTTIHALDDDLLLDIFLRLPSLPSLVRAALACRAFLAAIRSSSAFRRRFRALHPPPLIGFFFDTKGCSIPSFSPVRRRSDTDLAAAVRGADVFLTHLPYHEDAYPGWTIADCHGGHLLLHNRNTAQIAAYNPLTRALHLLPTPPAEISKDRRGRFKRPDFFLLLSDETPGSFRVISLCHDKSRVRAVVYSPGTRQWQIHPWLGAAPAQPSGKTHWLLPGWQANGKLYGALRKEAYMVMLDTTTLHFSFIDLPLYFKGQCHIYAAGETKDGRPCIVSALGFMLLIWLRRVDSDGVEKWIIDDGFPLEAEILQATEGTRDDDDELKIMVGSYRRHCVFVAFHM
ncbi:hypothetical protein BAE44_0002798 [Dichanthelium oligosanthes]|uniref:F-box protein AT5G49610-like beta-propeller domain-containing protein n=1 Tax=Dichanthelium oligosanthes TaxID=888268 RepID=A0A1E5WFR3_9POAL|nr:hypothetical protein BAE44_0002798 [Dichanthelium oligosanthes]